MANKDLRDHLKGDIKIEDFSKVKNIFAVKQNIMSYSNEELNKIRNNARNELSTYVRDVHGDTPVFEYPVMSFGDLKQGESYQSFGRKLWKYLSKDILDKYKPIEKVYLSNVCKSKKILKSKEKELLKYFTYGRHLENIEEKLEGTATRRKRGVRTRK